MTQQIAEAGPFVSTRDSKLEGQKLRIMPFCLFAVKDLPYDNFKQHFKNNWRPVFTRMTDGLELSQDYRPTNAELKKLLDDAMNRMKDRFSFIFAIVTSALKAG